MRQTPPNRFELGDLARLVNSNDQVTVLLASPSKWINWESALTLSMRDTLIVAVDPESKWQLSIAFDKPENDRQTIEYDPEMMFILRLAD